MVTKKTTKPDKVKPAPPAPSSVPPELEGLLITEVEDRVETMKTEVDQCRQSRSYTELEKDAVQQYWGLTQNQIRYARQKIEDLKTQLEAKQKDHQIRCNVQKHHIENLKVEHQKMCQDIRKADDDFFSTDSLQSKTNEEAARATMDELKTTFKKAFHDNEKAIFELEKRLEAHKVSLKEAFTAKNQALSQEYADELDKARKKL